MTGGLQQLMDDPVLTLLLLVGILLAFAIHEMGHAFSAHLCGDPTPKEHGRITLNPIPHLDPVGTIMLVVSFLVFGFPFGFAVTPINERKMRRKRLHPVLVAAAGPFMNLLILVGCTVGLALGTQHLFDTEVLVAVDGQVFATEQPPMWFSWLQYTALFNAFLIVFNLLPVPPLDGSRIIGGLMDDHTRREWRKLDQYGIFFIIAIILFLQQPFGILVNELSGALSGVVDAVVGDALPEVDVGGGR